MRSSWMTMRMPARPSKVRTTSRISEVTSTTPCWRRWRLRGEFIRDISLRQVAATQAGHRHVLALQGLVVGAHLVVALQGELQADRDDLLQVGFLPGIAGGIEGGVGRAEPG